MTDNLTRLHQIVESRRVDALMINGTACPSGATAEASPLWPPGFPRVTVILTPGDTDEGYTLVPGPPEVRPPERKRKDKLLFELTSALAEGIPELRRPGKERKPPDVTPVQPEGRATPLVPPLPIRFQGLRLHRKMEGFLSLIEAAGSEGIEARELEARIWQDPGRSRRKDAQIYVSKIRKRLDSLEPNRFSIIFDKGRYRLLEAGKVPAP